jgi:CBS domain-containing protein
MKSKQAMTPDPACCIPTDTASRIAKLMKTEDVGSLPVCEGRSNRKLVGIVTDRDLTIHVVAEGRDPNSILARDVMTRNPLTCHPDDDLEVAIHSMQSEQVRRIPVVDDEGNLVGIISQADVALRGSLPERTGELVEDISRHLRAGAV